MVDDIFEEIRRMREEMDRLFRDFHERVYTGERLLPGPGQQVPALRKAVADIQETEDHIVATIELPGMKKENISLNLTENSLEVKAETKEEEKEEREGFKSYRSRYAGFYRRLPLPVPVNPDEAKATLNNGVLEVRIPKTEKKKKKEISIE